VIKSNLKWTFFACQCCFPNTDHVKKARRFELLLCSLKEACKHENVQLWKKILSWISSHDLYWEKGLLWCILYMGVHSTCVSAEISKVLRSVAHIGKRWQLNFAMKTCVIDCPFRFLLVKCIHLLYSRTSIIRTRWDHTKMSG